MSRPIARYVLPFLLLACPGFGQSRTALSPRLATALQGQYQYAPPVAIEVPHEADDGAILQLEPFRVTAPSTFALDLLAAGKRAADAREAAKFSPLTGGLIWSKTLGGKEVALGIWPMLVPRTIGPLRNLPPMLSVDLLRIKW